MYMFSNNQRNSAVNCENDLNGFDQTPFKIEMHNGQNASGSKEPIFEIGSPDRDELCDDVEKLQKQIKNLELKNNKLEQRLTNAVEEKNYYKKHFRGEEPGANEMNGNVNQSRRGNHNSIGNVLDDFGKELLMANKRKYQLESRVRNLELELREAHSRSQTLDYSLKSTEKLLWLEKERSSTLETEQKQWQKELEQLLFANEQLRQHIQSLRNGEISIDDLPPIPSGSSDRQHFVDTEFVEHIKQDYEIKINEIGELKNKIEWRLGEVTQNYHDTKWRLGEVEAALAHKEWELHQFKNRVKQIEESSLASNPNAIRQEDLQKLKEEKCKVEWRLGEVNQWWNDAKWRIGELEAETRHRSNLLDEAHYKIGSLERQLEASKPDDRLRAENEQLRAELMAKDKVWNDAKWRIGELEAAFYAKGADPGQIKGNQLTEFLKNQDTFLIRKQPKESRNRWNNLVTYENTFGRNPDIFFERVQFVYDSKGEGKEVFLMGSFFNWECAIICEREPNGQGKHSIWLDLPPGRHEFRFVVDGKWTTAENYGKIWNEFGGQNNFVDVH